MAPTHAHTQVYEEYRFEKTLLYPSKPTLFSWAVLLWTNERKTRKEETDRNETRKTKEPRLKLTSKLPKIIIKSTSLFNLTLSCLLITRNYYLPYPRPYAPIALPMRYPTPYLRHYVIHPNKLHSLPHVLSSAKTLRY